MEVSCVTLDLDPAEPTWTFLPFILCLHITSPAGTSSLYTCVLCTPWRAKTWHWHAITGGSVIRVDMRLSCIVSLETQMMSQQVDRTNMLIFVFIVWVKNDFILRWIYQLVSVMHTDLPNKIKRHNIFLTANNRKGWRSHITDWWLTNFLYSDFKMFPQFQPEGLKEKIKTFSEPIKLTCPKKVQHVEDFKT